MLVLSRKIDETIIIDNNIEVKVLSINNNQVQLGIEAPDDVSIHREEIYREIQAENKVALLKDKKSLQQLSKLMKNKGKPSNDTDN